MRGKSRSRRRRFASLLVSTVSLALFSGVFFGCSAWRLSGDSNCSPLLSCSALSEAAANYCSPPPLRVAGGAWRRRSTESFNGNCVFFAKVPSSLEEEAPVSSALQFHSHGVEFRFDGRLDEDQLLLATAAHLEAEQRRRLCAEEASARPSEDSSEVAKKTFLGNIEKRLAARERSARREARRQSNKKNKQVQTSPKADAAAAHPLPKTKKKEGLLQNDIQTPSSPQPTVDFEEEVADLYWLQSARPLQRGVICGEAFNLPAERRFAFVSSESEEPTETNSTGGGGAEESASADDSWIEQVWSLNFKEDEDAPPQSGEDDSSSPLEEDANISEEARRLERDARRFGAGGVLQVAKDLAKDFQTHIAQSPESFKDLPRGLLDLVNSNCQEEESAAAGSPQTSATNNENDENDENDHDKNNGAAWVEEAARPPLDAL